MLATDEPRGEMPMLADDRIIVAVVNGSTRQIAMPPPFRNELLLQGALHALRAFRIRLSGAF